MSKNNIYILSEKKFKDAWNLPVIVFDYFKKNINLKPYDALIFSSKNGVLALDNISNTWKEIPCYSIGKGTSLAIKALGGHIAYEARSSYGDDFATEIKTKLFGQKVLFLRPNRVTSSLNSILLEAGVLLDEVIIYETKCNDCDKLTTPPKGSYIIFSSPSTITCFLACFSWDKSYQAIVIGTKTASYMPKYIPYILSEKQSIPACIDIAKEQLSHQSKN